jgi:hypothetical protein
MKTKIMNLFEQIANREGEIKDIREEIKDSITLFCEEHEEFEVKSIKNAYKFFKALAKDKSATMDEEYQRDKIVELLVGTGE